MYASAYFGLASYIIPNSAPQLLEEFGLICYGGCPSAMPTTSTPSPKHIPLSFPVKLTNSVKINFGGYGEPHDAIICTL